MPGFQIVPVNLALQTIAILLIAIAFHELAHALVANALGDSTPRRNGQLSLNPFVHMDQVGIVLLLVTAFTGFGFTYGRTFVTPGNLKFGPQRGNAIVALAGPMANLLLAAVAGAFLTAITSGNLQVSDNVANFLLLFLLYNVLLFVLNLLPLPPLDGFSILGGFLTARQMYALAPLQQWGPIIILFIFLTNGQLGILSKIINPAITQITEALCKSCPGLAI